MQNFKKVQGKSSTRQIFTGLFWAFIIVSGLFLIEFLGSNRYYLSHPPRSKISRVKADMRSLASGLESYFVDHGSYPAYTLGLKHGANSFIDKKWDETFFRIPTFRNNDGEFFHALTTPLAYITGYFADPFSYVKGASFAYYSVKKNDVWGWIVWSPGEDGEYDMDIGSAKAFYDPSIEQPSMDILTRYTYDPTNGTKSDGDVFRVKY
jgi:hypothetical protein